MNSVIPHTEKHRRKIVQPILIFLTAVCLGLFMISCGDDATSPGVGNGNDNGNGNGNGMEEPGAGEVWMVGQDFEPNNIEVEVGTTVTWENRSNEIHTVTSGSDGDHDGEFDSGNISPGEEYSYTFNETGTYDYFCIPHPHMTGVVNVVENDG